MPSTLQLQGLSLVETIPVTTTDYADYNFSKLNPNECVVFWFQKNRVAVLVCNIGNGYYRVATKPVPPTVKP
ncbi:hypothetical protein [Thermofilum pendens]|uniref:Uncharacterized protein n=1 Tax=Thermofilum pendens (strain DSM 2475 / Hrk 5) TaxID=368408 RepID=A1S1F1_THEPD|nr:hypothetical protein [Thermofilum pendens]ABL79281.1 hypothetical protein Tpen_1886 [Thermofilum pendens Hrk 5]